MTDFVGLADKLIGIQEDLLDEDDRIVIGQAAHYLRRNPTVLRLSAFTDAEIATEYHNRAMKFLGDPRIGVTTKVL